MIVGFHTKRRGAVTPSERTQSALTQTKTIWRPSGTLMACINAFGGTDVTLRNRFTSTFINIANEVAQNSEIKMFFNCGYTQLNDI